MIRVGRCTFDGGKRVDPSFDGFEPIVVMTQSSKYGAIGPYCLKNDKGQIMENIWQFFKLYKEVPATTQTYSRWDRRIIWSHPAETHVLEDGTITEAYFRWRQKGFNAAEAIRYPVGYNHRHKCLYALGPNGEKWNYIESRKKIYLPLYIDLVRKHPQYKFLLEKVKKGQNILIMEVDGPHQESLEYYKEKYKVGDDFIVDGTMVATRENLNIMLNDEKHPFGHAYCLSVALLMDLNKVE